MAKDCGNVQKVFVPSKDEEKKEVVKEKVIKGIGITEKAAEKIKHFATIEGNTPETHGLRVKVVKDGCSGNSYQMDLEEIKVGEESGDKFFEKNGATVMVEKLSYMFVLGSELDYVETLMMSGFQLVNPNVKKSCSCGSSFAV
jgi:iron-sulfur cluster assembly accessory protein